MFTNVPICAFEIVVYPVGNKFEARITEHPSITGEALSVSGAVRAARLEFEDRFGVPASKFVFFAKYEADRTRGPL
jgi:hypothetical protein